MDSHSKLEGELVRQIINEASLNAKNLFDFYRGSRLDNISDTLIDESYIENDEFGQYTKEGRKLYLSAFTQSLYVSATKEQSIHNTFKLAHLLHGISPIIYENFSFKDNEDGSYEQVKSIDSFHFSLNAKDTLNKINRSGDEYHMLSPADMVKAKEYYSYFYGHMGLNSQADPMRFFNASFKILQSLDDRIPLIDLELIMLDRIITDPDNPAEIRQHYLDIFMESYEKERFQEHSDFSFFRSIVDEVKDNAFFQFSNYAFKERANEIKKKYG